MWAQWNRQLTKWSHPNRPTHVEPRRLGRALPHRAKVRAARISLTLANFGVIRGARLVAARGYVDVNDADSLAHDPALRWIVGGRAVTQNAASASQMGRFETEVLTQAANLSALADLCG